ncbi:MAG: phage major tail tube protein, partial [Campylobacterales bacterium]|nr:phage major tail tube protein [Campylobacterales bacterium]
MKYPQMMKDINIFVDGIGHLGTSEEIKLPVIKFKKESVNRGGFEKDISVGTFEKLEAEVTISEYDPIVFAAMVAGTANDTLQQNRLATETYEKSISSKSPLNDTLQQNRLATETCKTLVRVLFIYKTIGFYKIV